MGFQKGVVTNPKGNPNIGNVRKTGPRTPMGKFRSALSAGLFNTGRYSKVLIQLQHCDNCPLKPVVMANGAKYIKCPLYVEGKNNCPIGTEEFLHKIGFYEMINKYGEVEGLKVLASEQYASAISAKQVETTRDKTPGSKTNDFLKETVNTLVEINKAEHGEKHVNVNVNMHDFLQKAFDIDGLKKKVKIIELRDKDKEAEDEY
jgi:hypothetical protein